MKNKSLILVVILLATTFTKILAQQNPAVSNIVVTPAPFAGVGSKGAITFVVGNAGTLAIPGTSAAKSMTFTACLGKCVPVPLDATAMTGAVLTKFDVTYDPATNCFYGIQKLNVSLPGGLTGMYPGSISVVVTQATPISNPSIGANFNIQPAAQYNGVNNTNDDNAYDFTYTSGIITAPDFNVTNVNKPVTGNVSTNDTIPAGTTYGTPEPKSTNPAGGTITLNPDGTYTFVSPNPGVYYYDVPYCAPYQVAPCPTQILVITVIDTKKITNPPIANTDVATTITTTPVTLNTLANDVSGNTGVALDSTSVLIETPPTNGTATVNPTNGKITYTAHPGFTGLDTLYYTVKDMNGNMASAMQVITVIDGTTNMTSAADDYANGLKGTTIIGNAKLNDIDPQHEETTITPQSVTVAGKGTFTLDAQGNYTFVPLPSFTGTVEFPYTITNTSGSTAKATIHILIKDPVVPLSVNWLNFDINNSNCFSTLNWTVSNIAEVNYFTIHKSIDGVNWNKIADITKIDKLNDKATFTYIDADQIKSNTFYKIGEVSLKGDINYSVIKTTNCSNTGYSVNIYPNPTENIVSITINKDNIQSPEINFYNMAGQKVNATLVTNTNNKIFTYSLSSLASGFYTVTINDVDYGKSTFKVIKK